MNTVALAKVLFVIDVQTELFNKKTPVFEASSLLQNINTAIQKARGADVPVIVIQHENDALMKYGSEGWALHPELAVEATDYFIRKDTSSAFKSKELIHLLDSLKVEEVVIMGLVSHGCVKAAVEDALAFGYKVTLIEDGHSHFHSSGASLIDEVNQKLAQKGAHLMKAAEVDFSTEEDLSPS